MRLTGGPLKKVVNGRRQQNLGFGNQSAQVTVVVNESGNEKRERMKKCHVPHVERKGTDGSQECLTRIRHALISQDGQAAWRFMTTPSAGVPAVADPEDSAPPPPPLGGTRASPSHKHVALLMGSPKRTSPGKKAIRHRAGCTDP